VGGVPSDPHFQRRLNMRKDAAMTTITTKDGTQIFYKDWSSGRPVVFSHGWPPPPTPGTTR
jgi:hypothetical protein